MIVSIRSYPTTYEKKDKTTMATKTKSAPKPTPKPSKASEKPAKNDSGEEDGEAQIRFSKGRLSARLLLKFPKLLQDTIDTVTERWKDDSSAADAVTAVCEHLASVKEMLEGSATLCDALPGPGSSAGATPLDVEDTVTWSEKHKDSYGFIGMDTAKVIAIHGEGRGMRLQIEGKNSEGKKVACIVLRSHVEKASE